MPGSQRYWRPVAAGALALLAACSSPNPSLYTIAPVNGPEQTTAPKVILLLQLGLERYLERSQIVVSSEDYKLNVSSNDWWGEPLGAMLSRILVSELQQRLPQSVVISEIGAVSAPEDATVTLNVRRLDEDSGGNLILQAQAGISFRGKGSPSLRNFQFSIRPTVPGVPGEVAAMSTAVGQLADGLVTMLVAGPQGR